MDKQHEHHVEKYGWVENKTAEAATMLIEATKKEENGMYPPPPPILERHDT